jgi:hypothetical protein
MAAKADVRVAAGQATDVGNLSVSLAGQQTTVINGSIARGSYPAAVCAGKMVLLTGEDKSLLGTYTDANGQFTFYVRNIGKYQLRVVPELPFVYIPVNLEVNVVSLGSTISATAFTISEIQMPQGSSVSGTVAWTLPTFAGYQFEPGEVVIKNDVGTVDFVESEPVLPNGVFSLYEIPPGNYLISLNSAKNGFTTPSPVSVTVVAGQNLTGINVAATYIAPFISASPIISGAVMTVTGGNFSNAAGNITSAFAGEMPLPAYVTSGWTSSQCQFDLSSLPPGNYPLKLVNPLTRAFGNYSGFTKPVQPPTGIVASEITDRSARITWQNAPFTQFVEIEYPAGTITQIQGNSFVLGGLVSGISISFKIRAKYADQFSAWVNGSVLAKDSSVLNPIVRILANSSAIVSNISASYYRIFGFEIIGNTAYIAYQDTMSFQVVVKSYDLITGAEGTTFSAPSSSGMTVEQADLCAYSNGLFLLYVDNNSAFIIQKLNAVLADGGSTMIAGAGWPAGINSAKMEYHGVRLFLAMQDNTNNKYVYSCDEDLADVQQVFAGNSDLANDGGNMIMTAADANDLYIAIATSATPLDGNPPESFQIVRKPLTNITGSYSNVAMVPASTLTYAINEFKWAAGSLFIDGFTPGCIARVLPGSGYAADFSAAIPGISSLASDANKRIWAFQGTTDGKYCVRIENGEVVQAFRIHDWPSFSTDRPNKVYPGEFAKAALGGSGRFGMLFIHNTNELAVLNYESSL